MLIYQEKRTFRPSEIYMATPDFAVILDDIAQGKLPTGSQRPFELLSERELSVLNQEMQPSPWSDMTQLPFI